MINPGPCAGIFFNRQNLNSSSIVSRPFSAVTITGYPVRSPSASSQRPLMVNWGSGLPITPTVHAATNAGDGQRWYGVAAISFLTEPGKVEDGEQNRVSGRWVRYGRMHRGKRILNS